MLSSVVVTDVTVELTGTVVVPSVEVTDEDVDEDSWVVVSWVVAMLVVENEETVDVAFSVVLTDVVAVGVVVTSDVENDVVIELGASVV